LCDKKFHQLCHKPPIRKSELEQEQWYCASCKKLVVFEDEDELQNDNDADSKKTRPNKKRKTERD